MSLITFDCSIYVSYRFPCQPSRPLEAALDAANDSVLNTVLDIVSKSNEPYVRIWLGLKHL
jgi:hypothetical protein